MTDWFFDLIAEKLPVVEGMLQKYNSVTAIPQWIKDRMNFWWIEKQIDENIDRIELAAVDGGGGYADLLGGGGLYIARAVAIYSSRSNPSRELLIDVVKYRARGYLDVLRMLAEIKVAQRAAQYLVPNSILLMDGSLYAIINNLFSKLLKTISKPDRIGLGEFYLLDRILETLVELITLLSIIEKRSILVAFVSKDSTLRVLKEYLAYMYFEEKYPKLADLMRNYPVSNRRVFLRIYRDTDNLELKSMLNLVLDTSYKDLQLIVDLVGSTIGYTKPLLLGALAEPIRRLKDKNYLRQLLSDTMSVYPFREKQEKFNKHVEFLLENLEKLRTPILSYVKIAENEPPLMVEILSERSLVETIGFRGFVSENPYFTRILKELFRDYKGRRYYNLWLIYAHKYAKLSKKQFLYYIRYIEALLSKKHIRIPFTRRYSMEA